MTNKIQIILRFVFAFIVIVIGNYVIVAQNVTTGDWKAEAKSDKPEKIYLSFERRTVKGGKNQMGQSYDFSDLQGLSREQTTRNSAVSFRLVREAGNIECEGSFQNGKGAGTFRFTPNPQFVSAMKSRGFDFEKSTSSDKHNSEDQLFATATLNLTTAFTDDLLSANFGKLDTDDLFKAVIFKITPQFMAEMKASGFANLGMEDLVKARIFKVDADFVRKVAAMGFDKEPFESLVKMRIFKITPEFLSEIQAEGLRNLDIEDYVKMKIFKIDGAFVRKAKAENPNVTIEEMVQMRIGVYGK
ncbi:MAG: hypothetical protein LC768_04545 [Acidobacteria bacterium]|nr:hypothetical protein [Acidobacteriota bacterium]MCA1637594.1 hypothetical protein [Acidobacteriota bacterium]